MAYSWLVFLKKIEKEMGHNVEVMDDGGVIECVKSTTQLEITYRYQP